MSRQLLREKSPIHKCSASGPIRPTIQTPFGKMTFAGLSGVVSGFVRTVDISEVKACHPSRRGRKWSRRCCTGPQIGAPVSAVIFADSVFNTRRLVRLAAETGSRTEPSSVVARGRPRTLAAIMSACPGARLICPLKLRKTDRHYFFDCHLAVRLFLGQNELLGSR
jgi:hypothetical protein